MGKALLVVESPAKARTISKYLGRGFTVQATVGHIKDLPQSTLGVDIEKDFEISMRTIKGKARVLQSLKDAASGATAIYLAADPDREGEAIAWHVAEEVKKTLKDRADEVPIYRILLHEITKKGITRALQEPGVLNKERYESQLARRTLDRLVGYELSPLLWRKVTKGLSAGRVQSVAVALIVDREREVLAFVPQEYWTFKATLSGSNPPPFEAKLMRISGSKAVVENEGQARPLEEILRQASYRVQGLERDEKKRYAPPPFITSTLQQDAFRLLRFSTKKTMSLAQRLYEGVDLGEMGTHGLITYMRTDSTRISDDAIGEVREHIEQDFGKDYLPPAPNRFKNRKSAQDAHEAIRPTNVRFTPDSVSSFLERDLGRLYKLIWNRFVACQMAPARFDVTTVTVLAGDRYEFEAAGRVLLFDGFLKVLSSQDREEGEGALPALTVGEDLRLDDLKGEQNFTQPPPRFTEGTLVKELERLGIGRPSTYATILSTIQDKGYIGKDAGKFIPTELGFTVSDLLREGFPDVINAGFTAELEESLDRVEEGLTTRLELLKAFWEKFNLDLTKARESMRNIKKEPEKTDVNCPTCGAPMVVRFGKNGAFLACSTFPECRGTLPLQRDDKGNAVQVAPEQEVEGEEPCPTCGAAMRLREGRFGRFWACSTYPKCKGTRPYSTGCACPTEGCDGSLVEKRSKKGKTFYGCSKYPECKYVAFYPMRQTACPSCGFACMEERGRGKKKTLTCPKCKHTIEHGEE